MFDYKLPEGSLSLFPRKLRSQHRPDANRNGIPLLCAHRVNFSRLFIACVLSVDSPRFFLIPLTCNRSSILASQLALVVKNPPANARDIRDAGLIPRSERSPGGGHGNPLQDSYLKNPHGQRTLAGYSP